MMMRLLAPTALAIALAGCGGEIADSGSDAGGGDTTLVEACSYVCDCLISEGFRSEEDREGCLTSCQESLDGQRSWPECLAGVVATECSVVVRGDPASPWLPACAGPNPSLTSACTNECECLIERDELDPEAGDQCIADCELDPAWEASSNACIECVAAATCNEQFDDACAAEC
jgi:hypothetical protein